MSEIDNMQDSGHGTLQAISLVMTSSATYETLIETTDDTDRTSEISVEFWSSGELVESTKVTVHVEWEWYDAPDGSGWAYDYTMTGSLPKSVRTELDRYIFNAGVER